MAKPPPDRRFDDSPFSGMPSRRVNRRPPPPADDGRPGRESDSPFSPPPPRRRPGQPRPDATGPYDLPDRLNDAGSRSRPGTSGRARGDGSTADRPAPPRGGRPPGDGYGDTHAELRWDTDRRLRPAYREGRDYLSPHGDERDGHTPGGDGRHSRDRLDQGDRPTRRRDAFGDPLRPDDRRRAREDRRPGPGRRDRGAEGLAWEPTGGKDRRTDRPVMAGEEHWPEAADGDTGTGSRLIGTGGGGPGGRVLAIAGVLFLAVSVVVASIGSMLSGSDDGAAAEGTQIAALTATDDEAADLAAPAGSDSGEPLVRFEDQPLPTSTLPPAGRQEPGYAGPWLDGVKTVCIDPGHGGGDRGRVFEGNDQIPPLEEAAFVLEQAMLLQDRLRSMGYVVVMTRTADTGVNADGLDTNGDGQTGADSPRAGTYDEIQARIDVCNRSNADLLISVHLNGYDTSNPSGYESWYTADRPFGVQSEVFAQLGVESIGERLAAEGYTPENRGAKDDGTYSVDDSDPTLAHNMLLTGPAIPGELTPSQMPGAIMESLFITNLDDIAFLRSANANEMIADAFVDAIEGYFSRFAF